MRWDFIDPPAPEDQDRRSTVLTAIDRWWEAFAAHSAAIDAQFRARAEFDLPQFMRDHLDPIHANLSWEFGPAVQAAGHRLAITPEASKELRPLVRTLLERAPLLEGWEFYGFRLPDPAITADMIEARTGLRAEGIAGRACVGESHRIDLTFCCPTLVDPDERRHAAFVATEVLLGEETLDTWIGGIDSTDEASDGEWLDLPELALEVERLRQEILANLAERPLHAFAHEARWTMLKLTPREAEDYPEQRDLFVAKTLHLELWRAAHDGGLFSSSRFSRHGETFCYLKLDGSEGLDEERFADKSQIEDALDAALIPVGLGCCIGGGTGKRYSYIDLALTDLPQALERIKAVLRAGSIPARSWILFFDSTWQDEWIGIWDHTPPPPRWPED